MTEIDQKQLGNTLWGIADQLRGAMNADDFRDYMLSFLFLRYLSDNYEMAAAKELGPDYPRLEAGDRRTPLALWYANNPEDIDAFETSQDPATGKKKTTGQRSRFCLWFRISAAECPASYGRRSRQGPAV